MQTQNQLTSIPKRFSVLIWWKTRCICLEEKKKEKNREILLEGEWKENIVPVCYFSKALIILDKAPSEV